MQAQVVRTSIRRSLYTINTARIITNLSRSYASNVYTIDRNAPVPEAHTLRSKLPPREKRIKSKKGKSKDVLQEGILTVQYFSYS
jgi:hypothetical protein